MGRGSFVHCSARRVRHRACSGAVHLASSRFFLACLGAAVLQRVVSCILFLPIFFFKARVSSCSFRMRTTNNSLLTMSSQVTASSHSGSGSSPAPTVNTPASPLSQPVSLPENNTSAEAIPRALAESLLLLLSTLRGSSGRISNMAATSSPLSLASNTTQSSASSRSGTPCSTSQSSGMLVVPSFSHVFRQLDCSGWGLLWWRDRI